MRHKPFGVIKFAILSRETQRFVNGIAPECAGEQAECGEVVFHLVVLIMFIFSSNLIVCSLLGIV